MLDTESEQLTLWIKRFSEFGCRVMCMHKPERCRLLHFRIIEGPEWPQTRLANHLRCLESFDSSPASQPRTHHRVAHKSPRTQIACKMETVVPYARWKRYYPIHFRKLKSETANVPFKRSHEQPVVRSLLRLTADVFLPPRSHEHIIKWLGIFEDADCIYLVQEHASGGDLFEHLKKWGGRMPEKWVITQVLIPLMKAMREMHNKGVIHR